MSVTDDNDRVDDDNDNGRKNEDDNDKVDIDNNGNDNGSKNEDEPEIEPGGHTKPSSNKSLSSCHLERKVALILKKKWLIDVINR